MATFSERKRIQKIVYLMQAFGVKMGFNFGWYIHGPYSTELTRVLYDSKGRGLHSIGYNLSPKELMTLRELRDFLGSDVKSSERLELIVSLHYLLSLARTSGVSEEDAVGVLKQKKPWFKDEEIQEAYAKVKCLL